MDGVANTHIRELSCHVLFSLIQKDKASYTDFCIIYKKYKVVNFSLGGSLGCKTVRV